ncbi:MAG TPA: NAD(P)/FAD-dependent oxidoreductase [Jatrophihabitans sp.]|nr:NAD(P)/FAD-dependent oxidoreductase [Jatrophihabitans sp.]
MAEHVDAVVIGAGLGGLAAAAALAGAGREVLVLEQAAEPGGYAQSFRRGAYRFDTGLHALNGLAPGGGADLVYRALGIDTRIRLRRLDPLYLLRLPDRDVVAHADLFQYESELIGALPAAAAGVRAYLDEVLAVYRDTRRMAEDQEFARMPSAAAFASRYPALTRAANETWGQLIGRHVPDPRAQTVLGALWGYVGLPPSRCSAVVGTGLVGSYHEHGGWYPDGGARALTDAVAETVALRGGRIRYGQPVTAVQTAGEHAVAVTTGDGSSIEADVFVSGASAPTTMLELVGRDRLPADYVARVATPMPSYTTFSVFLGLDRDLPAERGLPHETFLPGSADPETGYRAALAGDWIHADLSITDYTRVDPGCAPPGHCALVLTATAAWDHDDTWGTGGDLTDYHSNPRYLAAKNRAADALIGRAAAVLPELESAIREREAATPLTNYFYTRNPRGAIEGYENSVANSGFGWLPQQTPIANLFLAGAWTNTGGMNPALTSGLTAARLAMGQARVGAPA